MDIQEAYQVHALALANIENSQKYCDARVKAGTAKQNLDIILATKYLSGFLATKKNLGYEMSLIMLVGVGDPEVAQFYKDYINYTAEYKGLEKVLEANQSAISVAQSVMKYEKEGG